MGLPNPSPSVATELPGHYDRHTTVRAMRGDAAVIVDATIDALEPFLQVRRILEDMLEDCRRYSAMISYYFKTETRYHHDSGRHLTMIHSR